MLSSAGKGLAPAAVPRRPSFEGAVDPFPAYHAMGGAYEGGALEEGPRPYVDFLLAGAGPHCAQGGPQHPPKGYSPSLEVPGLTFPGAGPGGQGLPVQGPHYRPHLLVSGEPLGYGVQRSPSFQNKAPPDAGGYANLPAKGASGQPGAGHAFQPAGAAAGLYVPHPHHKQAPQAHLLGPPQTLLAPSRNSLNADLYEAGSAPVQPWPAPALGRRDSLQKPGLEAPPRPHVAFLPEGPAPSRTSSFNSHQQQVAVASPNTITAVTAAHILHPVKSVRVLRPEPQTAVGPSHPAWVPPPTPSPEGPDSAEEHPSPLGGAGAYPRDVDVRCPPPPYPKHLLLRGAAEQVDVDSLCTEVEQRLRGAQAEPPDRADRGPKGAKADRAGKDKKQIQTSPVPVRKSSRDEEKRESRIKSYSPYAFKFYMEQHVENVIKTYQQKVTRRLQLEQEMARVTSRFIPAPWSWPIPEPVIAVTAEPFRFCSGTCCSVAGFRAVRWVCQATWSRDRCCSSLPLSP